MLRALLIGGVIVIAGVGAFAAGAVGRTPDSSPATAPASQPTTQPVEIRLIVATPEESEAPSKLGVALVLATKADRKAIRRDLGDLLHDKGFRVVWQEKSDGVAAPAGTEADATIEQLDKLAERMGLRRNGIVLIAVGKCGPVGLAIIDKHHRRLGGAVLISVAPVQVGRDVIRIWRPLAAARSVPIWAACGTRTRDAAPTLVNWRKFAAQAPQRACITVDARIGAGVGYVEPDVAIGFWLEAIAAGKAPGVGPDRQQKNERAVYEKFAAALREAMGKVPVAAGAPAVSKTDGPLKLSVSVPIGWSRDVKGERKYEQELSPYAQVYLTPSVRGPLFARACAAQWSGDADGLLDDYDARLRRKGFLVTRYARWKARGGAVQISSVLLPRRRSWHRWLVLSAAGPGDTARPAAKLTFVMDATARPNVKTMAAALKRIHGSLRVEHRGKVAPRKPAPVRPE